MTDPTNQEHARRVIWEWIERNYPQAMANYRETVLKRLHRVSVMDEPADNRKPDLDRINARLRERYETPTSNENVASPRPFPQHLEDEKRRNRPHRDPVTGASVGNDRSQA